ncbi:MAG: ribonucleoside-diphosphate reductase [Magnetococcales bacterium]|nr:ribonucleoside-diphosphate reductase [Magnetococcales bacterium]
MIEPQPASLDIWDKKYRLKTKEGHVVDTDMDATLQRVARALADIERPEQRDGYYEKFLWALRNGALPAGRILSNAGALVHKPATSTINCTVSGTIGDSMHDILTAVHDAGLTLKSGCGIGYEFSTLRPKGALVTGAGASTSGPLPFMDIFDALCKTISSAGNRRGAQMATFDISHPDITDFIRAKRQDGRLRQFNLSCLITDEFMQAVQSDADWPLVFPANQQDLNDTNVEIIYRHWPITAGYQLNEAGEVACCVWKRIKARRLWDMIMVSTYDYAEPGFILIDQINDLNNLWWCETIRATNPCVTADTWVHTADGPRQVRDLVGMPFRARIDGQDYDSGPAGFFATGVKPVVNLRTVEGYALRLTADHRVKRIHSLSRYQLNAEWCSAADLRPGDRLLLNNHREQPVWNGSHGFEAGYLIGLLLGDGTLKEDKAVLSVWCPALVVNGDAPQIGVQSVMEEALRSIRTLPHRTDFKGWLPVHGRNEYRMSSAALHNLALTLGMSYGHKKITAAIEGCSSQFYIGFLRGLFDTDGSVQGSQAKGVSVRLAQSDLATLQAVQRMLLRLGIVSRIYCGRRAAGLRPLPDGHGGLRDYFVREQHELVISGNNLANFSDSIGFADRDKAAKLHHLLQNYQRTMNRERFLATVQEVVTDETVTVYDVQVPGPNSFDANGFHAHNCGEQPLPPHGSCLLGSINLTHFITAPFTDQAHFDVDQFKQVVAIFTRMLDNVVEIHGLPLPQQAQELTHKRRHGMGITGLGSALTLLRMKYGSAEAVAFTEQVMRTMAVTGWQVGIELAQEKGSAPVLDETFTVTARMLQQRPEMVTDGHRVGDRLLGRLLLARYSRYLAQFPPELRDSIAMHGCRFTHHTSIAPTGTISLSFGNNCSNGIEPSFAHRYKRNVIREGKNTKEAIDVWSFELWAYRQLVDATAESDQLPDYFLDADRTPPEQHIDMQAAAQRWVDSSISKTINVPTDFAFDRFKELYRYAWEQGCKGCTTFRFNPEAFQGVLVKEEQLAKTTYQFTLSDGSVLELKGNEEVEYDGEIHTAANLYDALKEGYYGRL